MPAVNVGRQSKEWLRLNYILLSFLFICAVFDIRYKKIPLLIIGSFIMVMVCYRILLLGRGMTSISEIILSVLPGVLLYVLSFVSKEIGNGDGLLMIATGCYFGGMRHLGVLFLAFLLSALISMGILLGKRAGRNTRVAFAPFLFTASGIALIV